MISGTLIRYNPDKGYGFIQRDDREPDVFVHVTAFADPTVEPGPGLRIEFDIGTNPKSGKPCAVNARLI
jgi:cold shock protein